LVVLPSHFTRLKDRVDWELSHNPEVTSVVVAVTFPREKFDSVTDWTSLVAHADPSLFAGWGEGNGISTVVGFAEPQALALFPAGELQIPPPRWDVGALPPRQVLLLLTVERRGSGASPPVFRREGTYRSWAALQAAAREGVSRLVVEVDLLQRPRSAQDLRSFGRRALRDLLKGAGVPDIPLPLLQGLVLKGEVVQGFVDLPTDIVV